MTFAAPGTNVTSRIVFNSGTLDFGSNRIVDVDNLTVKMEGTVEELYVLGSVLPQDLVRHTMKFSLTGKVKSFPMEMNQMFMGSSVASTPLELDIIDGQPSLQNPVLTLWDKNGKEIQYQFTGAIFKSSAGAFKQETYAEFDFELSAKLITMLVTA